VRRSLSNIASAGVADVATRGLGFLITAYLARVLGVSAFGMMSIGLSVLGYLSVLASPGVHITGARDVAGGRAEPVAIVSAILSLRLWISTTLFLLVLAVAAFVVPSVPASLLIIGFALTLFPMALSLDWFFQGKERLAIVSASKIGLYTVYLVLVLLLVRSADDVAWSALAFAAGNLAAAVVLLGAFVREYGRFGIQMPDRSLGILLRESLPLGVSALLAQNITNLPVIVLGVVASTGDAGVFTAAMTLIFFILVADRVLFAVFLPVLSRLATEESRRFGHLAGVLVKMVIAGSVMVGLVGVFYPGPIIHLVYGDGYPAAVPVLQILQVYFVATLVNTVLMSALLARKREREYVTVLFQGTGVLALLCIVLSSIFGPVGAATSLAVGEVLMALLMWSRAKNVVAFDSARGLWPVVAAGSCSAGIMLLCVGLSPLVGAALGGAGFALIYWFGGGLTREEVQTVRKMLA